MSIGLPEANINFYTKGVTAIQRSERGIVAMIINDDTEPTKKFMEYRNITEVVKADWSTDYYNLISLCFMGTPAKVIVYKVGALITDYSEALSFLKPKKWNYLATPTATAAQTITDVKSAIKSYRNNDKLTKKYVSSVAGSDHEGIIDFTTATMVDMNDTTWTNLQYTARIAGILAGLALDRSCTYFELTELKSVAFLDDVNAAIDNGELVLIDDGDSIKIARGVNSLITSTTDKGEEFRKIKIIEGVDLYRDDIRDTWNKYYVGKYICDYDNKQLLVIAINAYHKALQGNILDKTFNNICSIDTEEQRLYLEGKGQDTTEMSTDEINRANTGDNVFIKSNVKFVDAMEDLKLNVYM